MRDDLGIMSESEIDEGQSKAMFEFLGSFLTITVDVEEMEDLSDGIAMFEALSEISPDYFDPTSIGRNLADNWALKQSNLRKLVRHIEEYFHEALDKDADFESISAQIPEIAKNADPKGILAIFELVAAAAVTCEEKHVFVSRIMEDMSPESAAEMQSILQDVLGRLTDFDADGDGEDDDADSLVFDEDDDGQNGKPKSSSSGLFSSHDESPSKAGANGEQIQELVKERDDLRDALQGARRDLAAHKSQAALAAEDHSSEEQKLRGLAEDLQSRLGKVQDELYANEEDLRKKNRALEEAQTTAADLKEKNATLADELDLSNSKALDLRKAEATVLAYRRKLEGMGAMNQQMLDMEDQSANYLRQIMELENEVKKVPGLQKSVEEIQTKASKLQTLKNEAEDSLKAKDNEIVKLKTNASTAEKAKKMYQDELNDLRARHEGAAPSDDLASPMTGLSLASTQSVSQAKEKTMRLEIENSNLKKEIEKLRADGGGGGGKPTNERVASLQKKLTDKGAEVTKLLGDKEKLEAYTKKTLQKFQEKYLVALQDCKAKLKEKHDKIEALEMRGANEKVAQKREERLLSSSIYELGLGIMQGSLKDRSHA